MNETLRCLGISFSRKGSNTLERLINGEITVFQLTLKDIDDVLDAWETRKYVPYHKLESAIDSRPEHLDGETQEEYDRRHIEKIVHILQKI